MSRAEAPEGIEDPLVLLDEPTSALDQQDETAFLDLLARMKRHASFVFVSHRLTEVRAICDLIRSDEGWAHLRLVDTEGG